MNVSPERVSRFLSLILRHDPGRIGLTLDAQGWADVTDLLDALRRHGMSIDRATLERIVATNPKQRFALSEDGQRIRANQGHSIAIDLALPSIPPPETLYHGTAARFVAAIRREGLQKRRRQHVHLSADETTALTVGQRHGAPVVLAVRAAAMAADGYVFFHSANGVWLTDHVPPQYLVFPGAD